MEKRDRTEYHRKYAQEVRRATPEGKAEAVTHSLKWQQEHPEEYKTYQREYKREYMRKRRAEAKEKKSAPQN
jgi:hypothetical protein